MSAKLRRTHSQGLVAFGLSTTIAEAWDPTDSPGGARVRLMGVTGLRETAGTPVTVAVTDGTVAIAGTLGYFNAHGTPLADQDFGDEGFYASNGNELGLKSLADTATISCTLVGRVEKW